MVIEKMGRMKVILTALLRAEMKRLLLVWMKGKMSASQSEAMTVASMVRLKVTRLGF